MHSHDLSGFEFRPITAETRSQYVELGMYCFGGEPADWEAYLTEEQELACSLAAFDGDRMASAMRYFPYDMRIRSTFVGMGGVAAVVTRPEYRNRGLVRELITRLQVMMRETNRPLSLLMPFKYSYYYDMGWAPAVDLLLAEFEPVKLRAFPNEGYTVRRLLDTDEWETLEGLNTEYAARYNGPVCRWRSYWERRYFRRGGNTRDVYLVEKDGMPRGFIVCHLNEPAEGSFDREMVVYQAVWLDPGAERAIYSFFRSHRDQIKKIKLYLPADIRIAHHFDDPMIVQKTQPKMMAKLVDVPMALEAIEYDRSLSGAWLLKVAGERTAPWNDGVWQLEFGDGRVAVTRAESTANAVEISVQHLSQLYMGYRTVAELQENLEITGTEEQLNLLAAAFPAYPTCINDWF